MTVYPSSSTPSMIDHSYLHRAVQAGISQRERDGSEGRDGDGSERLCNNRVHRPAVAGQEEGRPCGICATRDVDDLTDGATLLGKGAYRMLIHIFWGIDKAGIGPAGPRCGANSWATTATSLEGIGLSSGELWPSSFGANSGYTENSG